MSSITRTISLWAHNLTWESSHEIPSLHKQLHGSVMNYCNGISSEVHKSAAQQHDETLQFRKHK